MVLCYCYYYYYCVYVNKTYCSTMQHISWSVSLVINFSSSWFVRQSSVITFLFPNTIERSLSVKYFTTSKYSKLLLIYINVCLCVSCGYALCGPLQSFIAAELPEKETAFECLTVVALTSFFFTLLFLPTRYYVYILFNWRHQSTPLLKIIILLHCQSRRWFLHAYII